MAENLNYVPDIGVSTCYNIEVSYCNTYGRLYNWLTAKTVCPAGWHLPSRTEWNIMTDYIGGYNTEGRELRATSGWNSCGTSGSGSSYLCEDTYGFSALPGGSGGGYFNDVGSKGIWWSANEYDSNDAYSKRIYFNQDFASWSYETKSSFFSVRCLQDAVGVL